MPLYNTMCDNQCEEDEDIESFPLPKGWSKIARHAVLNVIGIVRVAMLVRLAPTSHRTQLHDGHSFDRWLLWPTMWIDARHA